MIDLGWYIPTVGRTSPRWLLAVGNEHCIYSNGRAQRECQLRTFRRWLKRSGASLGGGCARPRSHLDLSSRCI